jgi:hypothetical protein
MPYQFGSKKLPRPAFHTSEPSTVVFWLNIRSRHPNFDLNKLVEFKMMFTQVYFRGRVPTRALWLNSFLVFGILIKCRMDPHIAQHTGEGKLFT